MKFFFFISLFTALLLGFSSQMGLLQTKSPSKKMLPFLSEYKRSIKGHFQRPELANILFALISGEKNGISPYTKTAFKRVNLSFLLSPSGIHLASLLLCLNFFFRKISKKWLRHMVKILTFSSFFLLPNLESIKRVIGLRLIFQLKFLAKLKLTSEHIFLATFILAFIFGHYRVSPLGFIYSFAFLGTFFSLKSYSKLTLILGLYSTQLIIGLFMGEKVSLLSIPCGLLGSFIFTFLFPIFLIFLLSFWMIEINWIEPIMRSYTLLIQTTSKYLTGSFTSSSPFLILAIWILIMPSNFRGKYTSLCLLFFLHTNTAMTPVIFQS